MFKKLIPNLVIDMIIPPNLYFTVHQFTNDFNALIIAGAVPVIHTLILGLSRRRIDWIGIIAILGFSAALIDLALSGGNILALKISRPLITGNNRVNFSSFISFKKPVTHKQLLEKFKQGNPERFNKPEIHKKFKIITAIFGFNIDSRRSDSCDIGNNITYFNISNHG